MDLTEQNLFLTGHCPSTGLLIFEALEPRRAGGVDVCAPGAHDPEELLLLFHISKNFLFKILLPWKFVALPFYTHFF